MNLPDFLIIGAMKAGTTTLYRDLMTNPEVFFPIDKEPGNLCRDEVLGAAGREAYARMFAGAKPGQKKGEASTTYTKLPDFPGVPNRARQLLGGELKVIYLVREPVSRIVSQHHHEITSGEMTERDINRAVGLYPRLLDYSRYAMQVEPWIDALGPGNVRVVRFEDYVKDRQGVTAELSGFLGVTPRPELVQADKVFNKGDEKPVMRGGWRVVQGNAVYQRVIRPLLPVHLKDRLRDMLLPKAPPRPAPPSAETARRILDELEPDMDRLRAIMNAPKSLWDIQAVLAKYAAPADAA